MPIPNGILCKIWADFTLGSQPFLFLTVLKNQHKVYAKKTSKELVSPSRIKQHLHIKKFYDPTENAVYLQLWITVCDYLLHIIEKKHFNIPQTLHTISKSIGPLLFK